MTSSASEAAPFDIIFGLFAGQVSSLRRSRLALAFAKGKVRRGMPVAVCDKRRDRCQRPQNEWRTECVEV
jgi:hypothetical protein